MAVKKKFSGIDSDVSNFISKKEEAAAHPFTSVENTKNERLSLYLPADTMQQIKLIAGATGTSKNKLVIDFISKALENPQYQKICAAMIEVNKNIKN